MHHLTYSGLIHRGDYAGAGYDAIGEQAFPAGRTGSCAFDI
jgi:hypothetical protein